jgi:anti-sigma factor RsiW
MQHPTDIQMMEFVGGRLPPDQHDLTIEHLASCQACRSRHQELSEVWDVLGQWDLPASEHDVLERVLAAAGDGGIIRFPDVWRQWTLTTLKAAASIVLAVGLGYGAARWNPPAPAPPPDNIEQRVAATLYLDTFESGTPAGLSELVLATAEPHEEEK